MYDYIIIGSGIAGLFTALLASKHGSVLLLTKAALEESNTRYAQGGIAAAISSSDSPHIHFEDTIAAGAGLCDERAVEVLTSEAPGRIRDLLSLNVPFDRKDGELALGLEGAHRVRRVLHAGGDATGFHIERTLCRALAEAGVEIVEGCFVTRILVEHGRAVGVATIQGQSPEAPESRTTSYRGYRIVLASGGAGQLFSHTTNPAVATGDGLALAYRAGAELTDIEFYQFHPTALAIPGQPAFLLSEALRGEGAYLRNSEGVRFMRQIHPQAELAPRDVVSRAISAEMTRSGATHVFLDLTHLSSEMIKSRFPTIYSYCKNAGLDMTVDALPVAPAAHYLMGGVRTNLWGETNVPGLYACGEAACTGVHGANRLASNSLLEGLVFGARIVERTTSATSPYSSFNPNSIKIHDTEEFPSFEVATQRPSLEDLQALMWNQVGLVRDERGLGAARNTLSAWQASLQKPRTPAEFELSNMILIGRLMAIAARKRCESRGGHFRSDFPVPDPNWQCHIVLSGAAAARSATEVR
ncbi:MAG TPA: L-aspartate oxidase [Blastocatellia bacterium]|nr:L-aspartate oxidase [Blastocatellia bacterium]